MTTLNDIFTWAKLKGSVEYAESQVGSFLLALGADDDVTVDEFASIPVANVSRVIDEVWLHSNSNDPSDGLNTELVIKPTEFIKARAMSAHHVARIWAGFVDSRAAKARKTQTEDTKAQDYRDAKLAALRAQVTNSTLSAAAATGTGADTVQINEVADTTSKTSVPVMSPADYKTYYKNYKKWKRVDPEPEVTPSRQQLSVLAALNRQGTCYVDMGLWGNFQGRLARAMRCEGMVPGPNGTSVRASFPGPPDFTTWAVCFTVYIAAMVMLEIAIPPWLEGYLKLIKDYDELYGHAIWAFLYQMDVRFRSEHMPYMSIRESDRLEEIMANTGGYGTTGYNPAKPWDYLWRLAADRNQTQESAWWYREFERKIPIVLKKGVEQFIEGDAKVAATLNDHFASTYHPVNAAERGRSVTEYTDNSGKRGGGGGGNKQPAKQPAKAPPQPPAGTPFTTCGKKNTNICLGYNAGTCNGAAGNICPIDKVSRHVCNLCRGNHPAIACGQTQTLTTRHHRGLNKKKGGNGGNGGNNNGGKGGGRK
ncbi:MAG: hypothetical protein L7T80_01840 [Arenicellales bacterium]|nr:hypothetical protein [Arenicellales bacterium]